MNTSAGRLVMNQPRVRSLRLGLKLEAWPEGNLSARMIQDLGDLHIKTVEDLAAVSDVDVTRIQHGRELRAKQLPGWQPIHRARKRQKWPTCASRMKCW
jgi:hypothetical protein